MSTFHHQSQLQFRHSHNLLSVRLAHMCLLETLYEGLSKGACTCSLCVIDSATNAQKGSSISICCWLALPLRSQPGAENTKLCTVVPQPNRATTCLRLLAGLKSFPSQR